MAFKIYRNNRIVPPLIGLVTIFLLWCLIDPTAQQPQRRVQVGNTASSSTSSSNNPAAVNQESKQKEGAAPQQPPTKAAHGESTLLHDTDAASAPGHQRLHSDEVLLILKTGATVLWRRLPIHLTTTLSPERIAPENVALYAEVDAKIGNWTVLDILKDAPPALQASDPFELYRSLRDWDETNAYLEQTGLPGDDEGPPGGWRLDKYKFLPLMQHAGQHWPQVKWYLYTEDDTYLFLPNVLWYLSSYDARESHWLGGLGEKLGTTFAHGGSGFALSRGAWEQSFGQAQAAAAATAATTSTSTSGGREDGHGLVTKYQSFVDEACCGDYALGKVLNDYGVRFGEDHGETVQFWGFNGLPHWKMEFSRDNWCVPVLTWHHAHSRDIARYYELERSWDFQLKPLHYGDFYAHMIAPTLRPRRRWWDNLSSRYGVTSTSVDTAPRPSSSDVYDRTLWESAWKSADSCEAACRGWSACVQWYYYGDDCRMDDRVFQGHGWPEGMRYRKDKLESVSGWLTDRVASWTCGQKEHVP